MSSQSNLTYEVYNSNSFAVYGDKAKYAALVKSIGGKWNGRMKTRPGWNVPLDRKDALIKIVNQANGVVNGANASKITKSRKDQRRYHRAISAQNSVASDDTVEKSSNSVSSISPERQQRAKEFSEEKRAYGEYFKSQEEMSRSRSPSEASSSERSSSSSSSEEESSDDEDERREKERLERERREKERLEKERREKERLERERREKERELLEKDKAAREHQRKKEERRREKEERRRKKKERRRAKEERYNDDSPSPRRRRSPTPEPQRRSPDVRGRFSSIYDKSPHGRQHDLRSSDGDSSDASLSPPPRSPRHHSKHKHSKRDKHSEKSKNKYKDENARLKKKLLKLMAKMEKGRN